jgi:hypothetical protein
MNIQVEKCDAPRTQRIGSPQHIIQTMSGVTA